MVQVEPLDRAREFDPGKSGHIEWAVACRAGDLCDDAAIHKLDHGMYHALRMNHNLDLVRLEVKQPSCFDHFQALFIKVAESMVILGPICQVGCFSASSGVTLESCLRVCPRKGPPDDVRITRRTS